MVSVSVLAFADLVAELVTVQRPKLARFSRGKQCLVAQRLVEPVLLRWGQLESAGAAWGQRGLRLRHVIVEGDNELEGAPDR